MSEPLSREAKVAVVESYFDCFVRQDFDAIPLSEDYTSATPFAPHLAGQEAIDYLRLAAQDVKSIQIKQHIVEGDHVATWLEEDTLSGPLDVFVKLTLEAGRIRNALVFYDPRKLEGGANTA